MRQRILLVVALAAALFGVVPPLMAQAEPFTLTVSAQHSVLYPPDKWVPLSLVARNNTNSPVDGYVSLVARREDGAQMELRVPMHLPANSRVRRSALAVLPAEVPTTGRERSEQPTPAVLMAELRSGTDARLTQQTLLGRPMRSSDNTEALTWQAPATTVVLMATEDISGDAGDPDLFLHEVLARAAAYPSTVAPQDENNFARHPAELDGVRLVLASRFDFELMDAAQRDALMTFLRRGGDLVIASPDPQRLEASWMAPYLPVQLIGQRLMDRIEGGDGVSYALRRYVPVTEAVAGNGTVVLADRHYVHAAVRQVGYGRVIFLSFPISALEPGEAGLQLWSRLLRNDARPRDWEQTQLVDGRRRDEILSRMIGKTVAPWGLAAGVTGAYLLGVVGVQVLMGGVGRPRAFGVTLGLAGILSVAMVAAGLTREAEQTPMAARVATITTTQDGGGEVREAVAFVGRDDNGFALRAASADVTLRVMQSFTRGDQPVVWEFPFTAPSAGMRAESYQRVWTASGVLSAEKKLAAVGRFDADGLTVRVNNQLGAPLLRPRVVWGKSRLSMGERIEQGESTVTSGRESDGAMLVSGEDKLRRDVLAALLAEPDEAVVRPMGLAAVPELVGFVEETGVPRLLETSQEDLVVRSAAVARAPLRIEASPVGTRVRLPSEAMQLDMSEARGLPYDMMHGEWMESRMDGRWLVGFRPPREVGALRPSRLLLDVNVNAPQHRIKLYRGQVRDGRPQAKAGEQPEVVWEMPVGAQDATIAVDASDADASGTVWLMLEVERVGETLSASVPVSWHVQWWRMTYEAEVVGPPPGQRTVAVGVAE